MQRSKYTPIHVCPICLTQTPITPPKSTLTCHKCGTAATVELKQCDRCKEYYEMKCSFVNSTRGDRISGYLTIPCQTCSESRYTGSADINVMCMSCFEETCVHVNKLPLNGIVRSKCSKCNSGFTMVLTPDFKRYRHSISFDSGGSMTTEFPLEIPTGKFMFVCPRCKKKAEVGIVESPDFFSGLIGVMRAQTVGKPVMPQTVRCVCGLTTTVSLNRCRVCNDGWEMDYKYLLQSTNNKLGPVASYEIPCSVCAEHLYNGPDMIFWACGCGSTHMKRFKKYPPNGIFVNKCKRCGKPTTLFLTPFKSGYKVRYITRYRNGKNFLNEHESMEYSRNRQFA